MTVKLVDTLQLVLAVSKRISPALLANLSRAHMQDIAFAHSCLCQIGPDC